jgi:YHS domain-containing protein
MFISNLVGVLTGLTFGIVFGRVGGLMGMMDGGMGGAMGGMMGAMLGVMLQYLYDGWAIAITNVLIGAIYVVAIVALVILVRQQVSARMETDPVCKMKVDPRTSLQAEYQGRTYYFCAPSCRRDFMKIPEVYVGDSPSRSIRSVPEGDSPGATSDSEPL